MENDFDENNIPKEVYIAVSNLFFERLDDKLYASLATASAMPEAIQMAENCCEGFNASPKHVIPAVISWIEEEYNLPCLNQSSTLNSTS